MQNPLSIFHFDISLRYSFLIARLYHVPFEDPCEYMLTRPLKYVCLQAKNQ